MRHMLNHLPSWQLVELANGGRTVAMNILLKRAQLVVERCLRRKCGPALEGMSDVDDVIQETLLSIARSMPRYDPRRSFESWSRGIAFKRLMDALRRHYRRPANTSLDGLTEPTSSDAPAETVSRNDLILVVKFEITKLPRRQREACDLVLIQDMSFREAAGRAGCSPGAVRQRVNRGCAALRNRIDHTAAAAITCAVHASRALSQDILHVGNENSSRMCGSS
jgi:RNA polymerase sigma-70 factor (ECF subfamily)